MNMILEKLKNKVIVSTQAMPSEPFYQEECMLAMIKSVIQGGSGALRLAGKRDIKNAKKITDLPIIGITKPEKLPKNWKNMVYITPTLCDVGVLIEAGADIIALDGTSRKRPKENLFQLISEIKKAKKLSMADIATVQEAVAARLLGVDIVSTTLSGYTKETQNKNPDEPDFELLKRLIGVLDCPIILEGKIWEPWHVQKAFELGAHSVVIGSAITRPHLITQRFVKSAELF